MWREFVKSATLCALVCGFLCGLVESLGAENIVARFRRQLSSLRAALSPDEPRKKKQLLKRCLHLGKVATYLGDFERANFDARRQVGFEGQEE